MEGAEGWFRPETARQLLASIGKQYAVSERDARSCILAHAGFGVVVHHRHGKTLAEEEIRCTLVLLALRKLPVVLANGRFLAYVDGVE